MNNRFVIAVMLSTILAVAPLTLQAGMVGTDQLLAQQERSAHMTLVNTYMSSEKVRSQMESMGVDPALAIERVAALTDSQLQQLAFNIDKAPAGSDALGLVVTVLVIILLLEILGITNISNKV